MHVFTDHKPLVHILQQKTMTVALQQWIDVLLDYDLAIQYRPGVLHVVPDALSRMYSATYCDPSLAWGTVPNITILSNFATTATSPSDFLCQQSLDEIKPLSAVKARHRTPAAVKETGGEDSASVRGIKNSLASPPSNGDYDSDTETQDEFASARTQFPLYTHSDQAEFVAGMSAESAFLRSLESRLTDDEKLLLAQQRRGKKQPTNDTEKQRIINAAHVAGHFGLKAMVHHIDRAGWYWPHMRDDVQAVIADCHACSRFNITKSGFHPARAVAASLPGDHYQIDLASFHRSLDGYIYCLILVDVFTGFIMLRALKDNKMSTIARELFAIFAILGLPRILQSDNGPEFCNDVVRTLNQLLGIPHRFIAPYNPRADGKVERAVRTVKQTTMKLLNGATVYWPLWLPFVQLSYNDKLQELTGSTAFALMFGREANAPVAYHLNPFTDEPADVLAWRKHQQSVLSLVFPAIKQRMTEHQAKYITKLDERRAVLIRHELRAGTVVYLKDATYLPSSGTRPSHEPMYLGPYVVVRRNKYGTYTLRDGTGAVLPRGVPLDQLKVNTPRRALPATVSAAAPAAVDNAAQLADDTAASAPAPATPTDSSSSSSAAAAVPAVPTDASLPLPAPAAVVNYDVRGKDKEYVIEKILAHRVDGSSLSYHTKFKGHRRPEWIVETDFMDTAIIDRYYRGGSIKDLSSASVHRLMSGTAPLVISSLSPHLRKQ